MMLLDRIIDGIQQVLSVLPDGARGFLWFPVLVAVVVVGLWFVIRHLLVWLGKAVVTILRWLIIGVGAMLLVPEVLTASVFRRAGNRPPGLVYGYGDTVAESVIGLTKLSDRTAAGFAWAARMHIVLIMLLAGLWVWGWNQNQCTSVTMVNTTCVTPISQWFEALE
ncbi:hypothetical protein ACGF3C_02130 [Micromonospora sp. NPDC047762]|uniref:hypothetical protein n=1 Tax=unclassified Micromonospora TaxID=2617518 RepID=UPI0034063ACA